MPVGTFRDVNGAAVRFGQRGVLKLLAALAAGHRPDAHATFLADIGSHVHLQGCEPSRFDFQSLMTSLRLYRQASRRRLSAPAFGTSGYLPNWVRMSGKGLIPVS